MNAILERFLHVACVVLALGMVGDPALAQRTGILPEGYASFRDPPEGLRAPSSLTMDAIKAARGNLVRWRDETRARIGPFLIENEAANERAGAAYLDALVAERRKPARKRVEIAPPVDLTVGQSLPPVTGYFAYFYLRDGAERMTVVQGAWNEPKSNVGDPMRMKVTGTAPDAFCGVRDATPEDVAYLGPRFTPELSALNVADRPPSAALPMLSLYDVCFTRTPVGSDFQNFYPPKALRQGIEGGAVALVCDIATATPLACTVASESPPEFEFGSAGLSLAARAFSIDPVLRDGSPSAGRTVCLTIRFQMAD